LVTLAGPTSRLAVIAEIEGEARVWELDGGAQGVEWRSAAPRPGLRGCSGATVCLDRAQARALASPGAVAAARRWWTVGTSMAAIGTARRALREAGSYLADRRQFGQPLADLPELDRILRRHGARLAADQARL